VKEKSEITRRKGVLVMADVVNYTEQISKLDVEATDAFNRFFETEIRKVAQLHKGLFIKREGDAAIVFSGPVIMKTTPSILRFISGNSP
jgi:class 3 adenylate cyclase